MLSQQELARLERVESQVDRIWLGLQSAQAGFRNRELMNGAVPGAAMTAGSLNNYAAVLLQTLSSGIFLVSVSWSFLGATAATSSTIAVTTQTNNVAIALTNTTAAGSPAGAGFVATTGAGIAVTGGPFGAITQSSEVFTTATAQTTGLYSWSGLVQNTVAAGAFVPFTKGNFNAFLFAVNPNTTAWTLASISISVTELMA